MRLSTTLSGVLGGLVASAVLAPPATAAVASDPDQVVTIAHRGAKYFAPENTLAAMRAGIDRGADMIEVDVRRSKDGRLVLLHDNDLRRTTNVEKVFPKRNSYDVSKFNYEDLRRLDAGTWKRKKYAGEKIPTLAQAIQLVRSEGTGLLLELKSPTLYPGIQDDVAAVLRKIDGYLGWAVRNDRLTVQSFDTAAAYAFKQIEPRVPVALLGTPAVADLAELSRWADEISARHKTVDATYVAAVHAVGMDCSVWTVNNEANMYASLDKGVDGVVTNRVGKLGRVLQARSVS